VSDNFELRISGVSEIDAMELENEIEKHTQEGVPVELVSEPLPNASASGDPGLAHLLLTFAPQVIPPLVAALAAWIAAGRKSKTSGGRLLQITKNGIVYATVNTSDVERDGTSGSIEKILTSMLEGSDKDTDTKTSKK
jgi:hypothetical protein